MLLSGNVFELIEGAAVDVEDDKWTFRHRGLERLNYFINKQYGRHTVADNPKIFNNLLSDDIDISWVRTLFQLNPVVEYSKSNYISVTVISKTL